jgi:RNA polymerase sigma factor (sigma-70 family)
MARIDVDYNARDEEGHVVTRVPGEQLETLDVGHAVSLYDPVDDLQADATVAWIDSGTGAVGFAVDWASFVDGDPAATDVPGETARASESASARLRSLADKRDAGPSRAVSVAAVQGPSWATVGNGSNVELLAAAAKGDQEAWDALVDRYTSLLWNITRQYGLPPTDAADVVQTTWLRLVENLGKIADPDRLPGWLATTARREALRLSRRGDLPSPGADLAVIPYEGLAPGERPLAAEQDAIVWRALGRLGEACQRLIRLLIADPPPSYVDVALILDMKVASIDPARQRCLAQLRELADLDGSER